MKDHSTMTTFEFLRSIAWKCVIGFIWYKNLLFRVLPHRDVYDSLRILLIMMLVSVACFIVVMNRKKKRLDCNCVFCSSIWSLYNIDLFDYFGIVYPSCRGSINSFITCIFDFAFQEKN